jgi:hypothetical protein
MKEGRQKRRQVGGSKEKARKKKRRRRGEKILCAGWGKEKKGAKEYFRKNLRKINV